MALNMNQLTLGEVARIEELSGMPISEIGDEAKPKGAALAALAFVAKRREDPKFSWQDAQNLTFEQAQAILGLDTDEEQQDPTPPASEQPSKPPAKKSGQTQKK